MPSRRAPRNHALPRRRPALEALESRAMFAMAPVHVVIPADGGVHGAALLPDGSIEIYTDKNEPFTCSGGTLPDGTPVTDISGRHSTTQWTISREGAIVSRNEMVAASCDSKLQIEAVSADGSWLAGNLPDESPAGGHTAVIWRRGSTAYIPVGLPEGEMGIAQVGAISNTGKVIYSIQREGEIRSYYVWDQASGLIQLESIYKTQGDLRPDAAAFSLRGISADGRTIVGTSGGGFVVKQQPTVWRDGVPTALPATSETGEITDASATSVSDDGRVIGGYVHLNTSLSTMPSAVWVDGNLTLLELSVPTEVVSGIGGDPDNWLAVGQHALAGPDGIVHWLHDYLQDRYGLSFKVNNWPVQLFADSQAIYLVRYESPSTMCAGFNCYTSGKYAAHLLVLPHGYERPSNSVAYDLSGDGHVSPLDVLIIINAINENPTRPLAELRAATLGIDVNGDGELSAADALQIINAINEQVATGSLSSTTSGEGESAAAEGSHDLLAFAAAEFYRDLVSPRRGRIIR